MAKSARRERYEAALIETATAIDKTEGRIIRYAKKLEQLRARKKSLQRTLAKVMAEEC